MLVALHNVLQEPVETTSLLYFSTDSEFKKFRVIFCWKKNALTYVISKHLGLFFDSKQEYWTPATDRPKVIKVSPTLFVLALVEYT